MVKDDTIRSSKEDKLSKFEVDALLNNTKGIDKFIFIALLHGGLRAGELAHMHKSWLHIDEDEEELDIDYIQIPNHGQPCNCDQCMLNAYINFVRKKGEKMSRSWYRQVQKEFHELKSIGELPELKDVIWRPKTKNSARIIPILSNQFRAALLTYFSKHNKFELNRHQIWDRVKRRSKAILGEDRRVYPHAIRATCANMWANEGLDPYDLTTFMGWESIATAQAYIQSDKRHMIGSMKRLKGII
jgi:integrase